MSDEAEAAAFSNLGWAEDYEPEWQFTSINADTRWTSTNPTATAALIHAIRRGSDDMETNPDEAAAIGAEEMRSTVPFTPRSLRDNARLGTLASHLDWSEAGIERIFAILQQSNVIPADVRFDVRRVVAPSHLVASRA